MKKILLSLIIGLTVLSCSEKKGYTISGKLEGDVYKDAVIYIEERTPDWKSYSTLDSIKASDGAFSYKGVLPDSASIRYLRIQAGDKVATFPIILEKGNIEVMYGDTSLQISGTPLNIALSSFTDKIKKAGNKESLKEYNDLVYGYLKPNINNAVGELIFFSQGYALSTEQLKEFLPQLRTEFRSIDKVKRIESRIPAAEATAIGKKYTDIKGKNPDGEDISLSDYVSKNKVVLIDFWASWCPPCREDMPELVALYDKYKSKGLEIVGVSWDDKADNWAKCIKSLNMSWPQMSDLKGRDSDLHKAYGIGFIPQTVLIDKEGTIVARNLEHDDLDKTIEGLLEK